MNILFIFILVVFCSVVGPDGELYQNANTGDSNQLIIEIYRMNINEFIQMRSTNALALKNEYNAQSAGQSWSHHISRSNVCLIVCVTILLCFTVHQTLEIDTLASGFEKATIDVIGKRNNIKEMIREMNEFQSNYSHVNLKLLKMRREINKLSSDLEKERNAVNYLGMNLNYWSKSWNRRTSKLITINPEEWKHALDGFETGIKKNLREETDDLKEFVRKTEPIVAHSKWIANIYDSHVQFVDHHVRAKALKAEQ